MIRYATNPPRHQSPEMSPHLYHRPRPSSSVHILKPTTPLTHLLNFARSLYQRWSRLSTLLLLLWLALVYHSEHHIWTSSVRACDWSSWERWPASATPHRVALVADPQLVDIHTYARRGVGLSATIFYSDLYLRRAWSALQAELLPSETYFLGDLFDGGREWAPSQGRAHDAPHDPREAADWNAKGMSYWLGEFARFTQLFPSPAGVRVKAGLPGNHDLGFGGGVTEEVRGRFRAYFGEGNDVWTAGNHSFVAVDTVSLSNEQDEKIFGPPRQFLEDLQRLPSTPMKWPHTVETSPSSSSSPPPQKHDSLPTVLLTHVPLYREAGTSCGPLREKGTAIPIWKGYQYQNVLTPAVSAELLKATGAKYVFSGDDHDACDTTHMYGTMGVVREWTVKSFSWNMGVRKPGVELVSLWNPLPASESQGEQGKGKEEAESAHTAKTPQELTARLGPSEERDPTQVIAAPPVIRGGDDTLQAHLCLLPDQIGLFLRYLWAFGATIVMVALDVCRRAKGWGTGRRDKGKGKQVLPVDEEGKYWKPQRAAGRTCGLAAVKSVAADITMVAVPVLGWYAFLIWNW
jgi:hypothetical protein